MPVDVGAATASTPTGTGSRIPTTPSTRSSRRRATCARPARRQDLRGGDLRLQPRRLVRRTPCSRARGAIGAMPRRPDRLAHRPRAGSPARSPATHTVRAATATHGRAASASARRARGRARSSRSNDGTIVGVGRTRRTGSLRQARATHAGTPTLRASRPRRRRTPTGGGCGARARATPARHSGASADRHAGRAAGSPSGPAGRGAPRIDPRADPARLEAPDGHRRDTTAARAPSASGARRRRAAASSMGRQALAARVLADPRIHDLRLRPRGHPRRRDRSPRAGHARVARGLGFSPTVSALRVRALAHDRLGQRLRALDRQRGRHRRDQRHPDRRPPGRRVDHRDGRAAAAHAAGLDEAASDHHADAVRRVPTTRSRWPTTPITSTSAGARCPARARAAEARPAPSSSPSSGANSSTASATSETPKIAASPSKYAIKAIERGPSGHPRVKVTKRSR